MCNTTKWLEDTQPTPPRRRDTSTLTSKQSSCRNGFHFQNDWNDDQKEFCCKLKEPEKKPEWKHSYTFSPVGNGRRRFVGLLLDHLLCLGTLFVQSRASADRIMVGHATRFITHQGGCTQAHAVATNTQSEMRRHEDEHWVMNWIYVLTNRQPVIC